jgi:prepilin-type N-terminal cleavage/methylation domain-containing protein
MDRSQARAAYTLMELVLVLSILVILAALAIPMMGPMFASSRVDAASDMVRARLAEMRIRAMEEGRPYSLKVSKNRFRVEPADGNGAGSIVEGELPGKVSFRRADGGRQESEEFEEIARINSSGAPDADVIISFEDPEGGRAVDLRLQRVTGTVTATDRINGNSP